MGPEDLRQALGALPRAPRSRRLLVGPETWDDAGVYRMTPRLAVIQTVDFITPVVNDPFEFGTIAAANSLSDVYAMGGVPTLALSIVCYPAETAGPAALGEILRGGASKLREANVQLLGGHSVRDSEMKFGFAVTGEVHPRRVVTNAGAKAGDVLILTKPLGTGILATALKRRLLPRPLLRQMTVQMATLNRAAAEAMQSVGVHAATDVTGFGLLGHALNVARASRKTLRIWSAAVPTLPRAMAFAARGVAPGGLAANATYLAPHVAWDDGVDPGLRAVLVDPQTSGGLLIAVPPSRADALMRRLRRGRVVAAPVGEVRPPGKRFLEVAA